MEIASSSSADASAEEIAATSGETTLSPGLRWLFLVHAVVQLGLGLPLLMVPETWASVVNWGEPFDPAMAQIAGGMFLGLALGQALAFRASTWSQVRLLYITVLTEVTLLFAVLLAVALPGATITQWGFVLLSGGFFVAFLLYAQLLLAE